MFLRAVAKYIVMYLLISLQTSPVRYATNPAKVGCDWSVLKPTAIHSSYYGVKGGFSFFGTITLFTFKGGHFQEEVNTVTNVDSKTEQLPFQQVL